MFYALAKDKLRTGKFRFSHTLQDIESLNRKALNGEYDVTAVSFHAYVHIADKYILLPSGASMGDRYGPMVVARESWKQAELRGKKIRGARHPDDGLFNPEAFPAGFRSGRNPVRPNHAGRSASF